MRTVVAGSLGESVHVAGVTNFLRLAEAAGWRTVFLGPAVPVERFVQAAVREGADLVGVSYRLTPENSERLLGKSAEQLTTCPRRAYASPLAVRYRWQSVHSRSVSLSASSMEASQKKRSWPF